MYLKLTVPAYTIKEPTNHYMKIPNYEVPFPVMCIDKDSYIVSAKLETSLDHHVTDGVHNLQIGKYSSLAEDILLLIDVDKDYKHACIGAVSAFQNCTFKEKMNKKRKGQIVIQNDCWIANGVTIMGGVTIHNGAIVAAGSVVTKDVPPYAVVGGNPARVIKYRFDEQQVQQLLRIAWWDWSEARIKDNAELFYGEIKEFISRNIEEANSELNGIPQLNLEKNDGAKVTFLFIPDFYELYPVCEKVIGQFIRYFDGKDAVLLIYMQQDNRLDEKLSIVNGILQKHMDCDCSINILSGSIEDERSLFQASDYFITTRAKENVQRMCFAYLYGTKCVSGVDIPVFGLEKTDEGNIYAGRV